ncbi:YD repeat (Two copies) [Elysia marginata]|uniref:YD repeat (Two copies) n=1 Tax=Elysia marginata TaxID=1093978 RepID=A0AAV4FZ59_9GAST|nr:YD repeat (Two copies) [Elysia marginata]
MAPPPTCYLRLSFCLHLSGFASLVAGYSTPFWTHIKLTTGDVQALGLVVSCYRDGCQMLHVTSERSTLVLALFSVQAFCLALCNGSCKTRNVGACYSYLSFLVVEKLTALTVLKQSDGIVSLMWMIDLTQQLRPDVTTVQVGWSRWCLVGSTGGFLLGAMLNTCDSVKRNRLHRQDVHKKAEVKGKMMAEMEARRRQAAAAALRAQTGNAGRRDAPGAGSDGGGGSGGGSGGGGGGGNRNFKMTAQVAARAAAASIVGARERGDFKGKRMSIAVDAAVTNALAQLNLHKTLAAGSPNKPVTPSNVNSKPSRPTGARESSTTSRRNSGEVILVNEAGEERTSNARRAESNRRPNAFSSTEQGESRDGGEDFVRNRSMRDAKERTRQAFVTTTAPTTSARSSTTTTTSLHNTTPTMSSTLPSIENLKKSKLTKADHVDSGQDLTRLARLPVVTEERGDHPTTTLDEKSRARLEEAEALRRRVSDAKGFSINNGPTQPQVKISSNKRDDSVNDGTRNDLSLSVARDKSSYGNVTTSSNGGSTNTHNSPAGYRALRNNGARDESYNDGDRRNPGLLASTSALDTQRDHGRVKSEELHVPASQARRKSALGDALLGVSSFISDTVSIGGDKSATPGTQQSNVVANNNLEDTKSKLARDDALREVNRCKNLPKSPSVVGKPRDSMESFSQEMGIDPLPPVLSLNRNQLSNRDSDHTATNLHSVPALDKKNYERSPDITALQSYTADNNRRGNSETTRGNSETTRGNSETSRGNSETTRGNSETTRRNSETTRGNSETTRGNSETTRSNSEATRGNSEATNTTKVTHAGPAGNPDAAGSNRACDDGRRVILPRLTSVESTSKPAGSGDSTTTEKVNGHVVKVQERTTTKGKSEGSITNVRETTKTKDRAAKSEALPAQVSEEEMKRRKVVENMVRVSRETRKKRITQ